MMRFRYAGALFAIAVGVIVARPAAAYLVLTYDNPVLHVGLGGSVDVRATLSVVPGGGLLSLETDALGNLLPLGFDTVVGPVEEQFPPFFICLDTSCSTFTPEHPLQYHSTFTPTAPNPLGNLDLVVGSSVDLDLGTLAIDTIIAPGIYTTDIGVGETFFCTGFCEAPYPFSGPAFDAGPLTIDVSAVPEPSTLVIFGTTLFGFGWLARRRRLT